jgi:acyl-coenzyme A thioesterase 13
MRLSRVLCENQSFIERIKLYGINSVVGHFTSKGCFDRNLTKGFAVTAASNGQVECELLVDFEHANNFGTLHGGCTSLLIDVVGTLALLSTDPLRPGVSVELNCSFARAAKIGETVKIVGKVEKTGKRLGYTTVTLYNAKEEVVALGRHVKAFQ